MAKYGLITPFWIDNGELDSLSKQECFTLGYEFSTFMALLDTGDEFEVMVHSENRSRLLKLCDHMDRIWGIHDHDDWPTIHVFEKESVE